MEDLDDTDGLHDSMEDSEGDGDGDITIEEDGSDT